jgi:hypothetical protein
LIHRTHHRSSIAAAVAHAAANQNAALPDTLW